MRKLLIIPLLFAAAQLVAAPALKLSWQDNSDNEEGFRIERKAGAGEWQPLTTLPANATTYEDAAIAESTTYAYRVLAFNQWGDSAWSNEATTATGSKPAAPSGSTVVITIKVEVGTITVTQP
jgi:hypothetical protein